VTPSDCQSPGAPTALSCATCSRSLPDESVATIEEREDDLTTHPQGGRRGGDEMQDVQGYRTHRRNPGMLFDLIKACAPLFRFQREIYDGGIRADRSDFAAAARIYAAINGEAGGQETKLTKNESAALETVATMGWEQFTVKMLDGPGPDPDDTCNFAAGLQQICSTCREDQKARDGPETDSTSTDRETRLSLSTNLQQNTHPQSALSPPVSGCAGGCDPRFAANDLAMSPSRDDNQNLSSPFRPLNCSTFRKLLQTAAKKKGPLQESLPGVLEHTEFTRVSTDLGRCSVCDEGRAVFRSGDGQIAAVSFLKEHGTITNTQYQNLTGVAASTALRDLNEMVTKHILERRGMHYVVFRGRGGRRVLRSILWSTHSYLHCGRGPHRLICGRLTAHGGHRDPPLTKQRGSLFPVLVALADAAGGCRGRG
jgi:hypothetical protein